VAWADDPPTIVTPFIDGDDVVSIMRRRDDPAWQDHMIHWMSQAGAMLSAYHATEERPATDEEIEEAANDARRVAHRVRVSPDVVREILEGIDPIRRTARSYGDFGPGNLLGTPDGELYLLDPPVQPPRALIHRDLGNFVFELRRQLTGHGFTRHPPLAERFPPLREALLDGYSGGGDRLHRYDLALIALFEARRCAGMARKRFPSRPGDVWWFARSALSRRREALSSAASQP
jgi:hypothetical protein